MRRVGIAVLSVAACGRFNFDDVTSSSDASTTPVVDADLACPASYMDTPDGCYRIVATPADWLTAEHACEADGAHLIVLDDLNEHYLLHSMLGTAGIELSWLGFTDRRVEATFVWLTQAGLDPASNGCYWGGSPTNRGNSASNNCVVELATNACPDWNVLDCASPEPYVCEHDGTPADPSRY